MKEERTEYASVMVTPSVKKELDEHRNNEAIKEKIIRQYITDEVDWIKDEMKQIDEINIVYKAKLVAIKDNFRDSQDEYVKELEDLTNLAYRSFKKIDSLVDGYDKKIQKASHQVKELSKSMAYINVDRIEQLMNAVDRFNKYSEAEKELIKQLIEKR